MARRVKEQLDGDFAAGAAMRTWFIKPGLEPSTARPSREQAVQDGEGIAGTPALVSVLDLLEPVEFIDDVH